MTIDETLKSRIVAALRAGDRNARNPEDRQEARELVYLLTVEQAVPAPAMPTTAMIGADPADMLTEDGKAALQSTVAAPAEAAPAGDDQTDHVDSE